MRSRRPGRLHSVSAVDRMILGAIAAGRVSRAGEGAFAPYVLDGGADVTTHLRSLHRGELVVLPLLGPPHLSVDGEQALTDLTSD